MSSLLNCVVLTVFPSIVVQVGKMIITGRCLCVMNFLNSRALQTLIAHLFDFFLLTHVPYLVDITWPLSQKAGRVAKGIEQMRCRAVRFAQGHRKFVAYLL